jgi:hypothetical protein
MKKRVLWSLVAMVTAGVASADAYRWVDEKGNVVYSQKRPTGEQTAERVPLPAKQPSVEEEATTPETKESEKTKKPTTAKELDPAVREKYCDKAKKNVELLENSKPGTAFVTEDKTLVKFDAEEIAKRLEKAREAVQAYCE